MEFSDHQYSGDPYNNPRQGTAPRALFVCSMGMLRSATAAHFMQRVAGWNTRCVGIRADAVQPLSWNVLKWAEKIYCMEEEHRDHLANFWNRESLMSKVQVLGIPDRYDYMDSELCNLLRHTLGFPAEYASLP